MTDLAKKTCEPCAQGTAPLKGDSLRGFMNQIEGWELIDEKKIVKKWGFPDFKKALAFVNLVGELAESQGHHPDISFGWGKVKISLTTHKIGGLSESDFIFAAKCDTLPCS